MNRTGTGAHALFALTAVLCGVAVVGCSFRQGPQETEGSQTVGAVGLQLRLNDGANVFELSAAITGAGITQIKKTIPLSDPSATVSLFQSGIPAGSDYEVVVSGASSDGKTSCLGKQKFDVVAGTTTQVIVVLLCRTMRPPNGSIIIKSTVDVCPVVTSLSAAPLRQSVGSAIEFEATAFDPDPNDTLIYTWTAATGMFASPSSASTVFYCTAVGTWIVALKVSDGQCDDTISVDIECAARASGQGGARGSAGAMGAAGSGPGGVAGAAGTSAIRGSAGSGAGGHTAAVGGSGAAGSVGQADVLSEACSVCISLNCSDPTRHGCSAADFTPTEASACDSVLACTLKTACAVGDDVTPCLCGTATQAQCINGAANGPCKGPVFSAVVPLTAAEDAIRLFSDSDSPLGRATKTSVCARAACSHLCP